MTTIAAKPSDLPPDRAPAPRADQTPSLLANLLLDKGNARYLGYSLVALLAAAFFTVYYRWFNRQLGPEGTVLGIDFGPGSYSFNHFEDWGHAYIIPVISAAYIYVKRDTIDLRKASTFWPALAPLALGILIYVFFSTIRPTHMFQGVGILLSLASAVLLLFGPRLFRHLLFPLAYLFLGVTIAEQIMLQITFPLRALAADGGHLLLTILGVDNRLQGNIIYVFDSVGNEFPLDVAEACSGMRMVVAFIALSIAVAFFSCRQWWQRTAVMLVAVPVALVMNVVRVAVLSYATLYDPDLAAGAAHTLIGTLLLIPAFILFMGCVWIFKHATPDEPLHDKPAKTNTTKPPKTSKATPK